MAVPKRRTSKMKKRLRRNGTRWHAAKLNQCKECGSAVVFHCACRACGYYNGRQVLTVEEVI